MARIPEGLVERIKRDVSLERLVQGKGVALNRKGRDLVGLCVERFMRRSRLR